jgi:hypothetical protein
VDARHKAGHDGLPVIDERSEAIQGRHGRAALDCFVGFASSQ